MESFTFNSKTEVQNLNHCRNRLRFNTPSGVSNSLLMLFGNIPGFTSSGCVCVSPQTHRDWPYPA